MSKYQCEHCGETHDALPVIVDYRPIQYWDVPEALRSRDVHLEDDHCVVKGTQFLVRAVIEIPLVDLAHNLNIAVWVSLSEKNFGIWKASRSESKRKHLGPFFGWLCSRLPIYPETALLKAKVQLRDGDALPCIELEPTQHPLAVDQRNGMTLQRAFKLAHDIFGKEFFSMHVSRRE